ncbi:progesterone binding protein-like protein [Aaosphaeria arxii CBS 175.79]|uniref:Progesterone binding protein-like protein n=1 Tax=Aaosphaeria arxii CBS 175.79 TaxID=1450172 RepID=A0A6A5XB12_9PLEO|nr:progesterone binding protein-like protein [Aaosphaeria arxii CBS 175.79]KAF2010152.1 progesterone binding protein-like protein [Aaosphaeria arxii CBS 175.79]
MADTNQPQEKKEKFAPKEPVQLNPPKDDIISLEHLAKCNGETEGYPTYVAIKGTVFDVSGKETYAPGKGYHVFAGKEPNRALALSSLKEEDAARSDYDDLDAGPKKVLDDWYTFFSKRYNVVGKLQSSSNL